MARKTLRDDKGREYEADVPDDDDDEETIWLDAEDIEWLKRKRLEESEADRQRSTSSNQTKAKTKTSGKVVRIRAKQADSGATSQPDQKTRKRVLRLA